MTNIRSQVHGPSRLQASASGYGYVRASLAVRYRFALEKGQVILCDRFSDATIAYQAYGRGLPLEAVREICRLASRGLSPHLTLLFDLPVEKGLERAFRRIAGREEASREDRFEREHLDFHRRIREGYLAIAREEPGRVKIVDASRDIESTRLEVRAILSSFLGV